MAVKLTQQVKVKNILGLHTRPATVIVKLLQNTKCDILFTHKRETINAKSILSILMLAARKNSKITITVAGEEEQEAIATMDRLVTAFDKQFGEC